jgi:predicted site-specific integrase-resolvase
MNKPGTQLLSIGEAAAALGVAVATLRCWHRQGRLLPALRTFGGHRGYSSDAVRIVAGAKTAGAGKTICYARVSSHDQREQILTQAARLERYCHEAGFADVEVVTDLGSGLNYRKKGLQRVLLEILRGRVTRLVIAAKVRLARFGSELLFQICQFFGVEVVVLDAAAGISREQQLTEDLVEILTLFSSRLYGSRSRKNLKALAG